MPVMDRGSNARSLSIIGNVAGDGIGVTIRRQRVSTRGPSIEVKLVEIMLISGVRFSLLSASSGFQAEIVTGYNYEFESIASHRK